VATQKDVKAAQEAAKVAQDDYNASIAGLAPAGGRATQIADGLRKAIDALHGAARARRTRTSRTRPAGIP
jgi:hypothetical protein